MHFRVSVKMKTSLQWSSIMLLSSNQNQNISVSYESVKFNLNIFNILQALIKSIIYYFIVTKDRKHEE